MPKEHQTPRVPSWEGDGGFSQVAASQPFGEHGRALKEMQMQQIMANLLRYKGMNSRDLSFEGNALAHNQRTAYPGAWEDFIRGQAAAFELEQNARRPDSPEGLLRRYGVSK